jgi:predicted component of type VI protein secretion system
MKPPETRELPADGALAQSLVHQFQLTVIEGPDADASYSSTGARTIIGTHPSADLVLRDRAVSRFHCEISIQDGRVVLRDLESRNGTEVDGLGVLAAYLRAGAVITLGKTRLRFTVGEDRVRVPLSEKHTLGLLVGGSAAMRAAFAVLERAAASDATLLLEGETGCGKEAATETVHRESARKEGPLVVVDCGAVPAQLLESELVGHERGAFTGAIKARAGAFESADGGTLFLDEIGELGPELQPSSYARSSSARSSAWAATAIVPSTFAWWRPPTATCARR